MKTRKTKIVVTLVFVGLVILGLVMILLFRSGRLDALLARVAIGIWEREYNVAIHYDRLEGRILSNPGVFNLIIFRNGLPIFSAARLSLEYRLFRGSPAGIIIDKLVLDTMKLTVNQASDGTIDLMAIFPGLSSSAHASEAALSPGVTILDLRIRDGRVEWIKKTPRGDITQQFEHLDFAGSLDANPDQYLTIKNLSFTAVNSTIRCQEITGLIGYSESDETIHVESLQVATPQSQIVVNGKWVIRDNHPEVTAVVQVDHLVMAEFKELNHILGMFPEPVAGFLTIDGKDRMMNITMDLHHQNSAICGRGTMEMTTRNKLNVSCDLRLEQISPPPSMFKNDPLKETMINADIHLTGAAVNGAEHEWTADIALYSSVILGQHVSLSTTASLNHHHEVAIKNLECHSEFGHVAVQAARLFRESTGDSLTAEFNGTFRSDNPTRLFPALNPINVFEGNASGNIQFHLPSQTLTAASFDGELHPFLFNGIPLTVRQFSTRWDGAALTVGKLALTSAFGNGTLTGKINPTSKQVELNYAGNIPDLGVARDSILPHLPSPMTDSLKSLNRLSGALQFSGMLSGTMPHPQTTFRIHGDSIQADRFSLAAIKIDAGMKYQGDRMIGKFAIDCKEAGYRGHTLASLAMQGSLTPEDIDFASLTATYKNVTLSLRGGRLTNWTLPEKRGEVASFQLGLPCGNFTNQHPFVFSFSSEGFSLPACTLQSPSGDIAIAGGLNRQGSEHLRIIGDYVDLADWNQCLPAVVRDKAGKLQGILSGEARIGGEIDRPNLEFCLQADDLKARIMAIQSLTINGQSRDCSQQIVNEIRVDVIGVESETFHLADLRVTSMHDGNKNEVTAIAYLENGDSVQASAEINRWLATEKEITMTQLSLSTSEFIIANAAPISVRLQPEQISIPEFVLDSNDGTFTLNGRLESDKTREVIALSIDLNAFPLNVLASWFTPSPLADGKITGHMAISGTPDAPEVSGRLKMTDLTSPVDPALETELGFDFHSGKLRFDAMVQKHQTPLANIAGYAGMTLSLFPLAFSLDSESAQVSLKMNDIRVSQLPTLFSFQPNLEGILNADLTLTMVRSRPVFEGRASFHEGVYTHHSPDMDFTNLNLDAAFTPGNIRFLNGQITSEKVGTVTGTGTVKLNGLSVSDYNLDVRGENLLVDFVRGISANVTGQLILNQAGNLPRMQGKIFVNESHINLDQLAPYEESEFEIIGSDYEKNNPGFDPEKHQQIYTLINDLMANIAVDLPRNVWIRGKGIKSELIGNLTLRKISEQRFTLHGDLSMARSSFNFHGKLFRITKGHVQFIGLEDPNPRIDMHAVTRVKSFDIMLNVTGTAKDLRVSLNSDPPLPQSDIISYLLFGNPVSEFKGAEAFDIHRAAMQVTGQLAITELNKILDNIILIDVFTVENVDGDSGSGAVFMGKYLAPSLFVSFRQGFDADDPRQLRINYELTRNLGIEAQVGDERTNGVDLLWEFQ